VKLISKTKKTKYASVTLDKTFVKTIDEAIKGSKGTYQSRADFLREACRNQLRKIEAEGI